VPDALVQQLKPGGILVIPVGNEDHQEMLKISKDHEGNIVKESHDFFRFVPLVGRFGWQK
jgi:protein-L-isoaspartate(D-aspartate) O-methyltransferase